MDVKDYMQRAASRAIARTETHQKNKALLAMADAIERE